MKKTPPRPPPIAAEWLRKKQAKEIEVILRAGRAAVGKVAPYQERAVKESQPDSPRARALRRHRRRCIKALQHTKHDLSKALHRLDQFRPPLAAAKSVREALAATQRSLDLLTPPKEPPARRSGTPGFSEATRSIATAMAAGLMLFGGLGPNAAAKKVAAYLKKALPVRRNHKGISHRTIRLWMRLNAEQRAARG